MLPYKNMKHSGEGLLHKIQQDVFILNIKQNTTANLFISLMFWFYDHVVPS